MRHNLSPGVPALLHSLLEAAWRRRVLLALPLVIILPLGLAYAKYGPKVYDAKTVLLLQETGDNPLTRDIPAAARINERLPSLQRLLRSERVMHGVMTDVLGSDAPTDQIAIARWIRDFASQLSLDLVGSEFLEITLRGTSPQGLGKELEAVTSRFLEALLSTEDALGATQVLLAQRKEQQQEARQALDDFRKQFTARFPASYPQQIARLPELEKALAAKAAALSQVSTELSALRRRDAELKAQSTRAGEAAKRTTASGEGSVATAPATAPSTDQVSADAEQMLTLEKQSQQLQVEVNSIARDVGAAKRLLQDVLPQERQLAALEANAKKTLEEYELQTKRFGTVNLVTERGSGLLRSPERIKILDAPHDPELPTNGPMKIILGSLFAALASGIAMAVIAELFDTRLRRSQQLEALTGASVIARL